MAETRGGAALSRISQALERPVDIAPLVYFRICFGSLLACYLTFMLLSGLVRPLYLDPQFHFTYFGFSWVKPLPGAWTYVHLGVTALAAACVAAGAFYRVASVTLFVGWTYMFLLDQAYYMNHFYLVSLYCALIMAMPLNRCFSVDCRLGYVSASPVATAWTLYSLRACIAIVYFYAGVSKLYPDWLHGEPMRGLLLNHIEVPLFGVFARQPWAPYFLAYGGLFFDLLAAPGLLWRKTRTLTVFTALGFHATNICLFKIDFFPVLAVAATLLFYPPEAFRNVFNRHPLFRAAKEAPLPPTNPSSRFRRSLLLVGLSLFFTVQVLVPLRHWAYPGDHCWTEEGHRFSWHLMLRNKTGRSAFLVVQQDSGEVHQIDPAQYLNSRQVSKLAIHPDMILQFAHFLRDRFQTASGSPPQVMAFAKASLNRRPLALLLDPKRNLALEKRTLWPQTWLLPLSEPLRSGERDSPSKADNVD